MIIFHAFSRIGKASIMLPRVDNVTCCCVKYPLKFISHDLRDPINRLQLSDPLSWKQRRERA